MPMVTITLTETIEVPEGSQIVLAYTGNASGVRLPDGNLIKPWISYEHFLPGQENGDPAGDLCTDGLSAMDVHTDMELSRTIASPEGDVDFDVRAVGRE